MLGHHKNTCKNVISLEQYEGASVVIKLAQKITKIQGLLLFLKIIILHYVYLDQF
jgi:hypothetical protein